ncbi:hypothetical protein B0H10DRAFT_2359518 [Mycena sp. CBHHK59/15]|nr:hypothetical protein B0H10DRAFT_2359518 [Mycena sp. CBHHK59/15]
MFRADVEAYMRRFREITGTLVEDSRISEAEVNLYFVTGLPQRTFKAVENKLPEDQRVVTKPPKMKDVQKILNGMFKENSLEAFARQNFLDSADISAVPMAQKPSQKAVRFETVTPQPADPIDELRAGMERLTIAQAELLSRLENRPSSPGRPTTPDGRRCFVCGETGKHATGPRNCPLTYELLNEQLVIFSTSGRLTARDGSELPMSRDQGGIAQLLRRRAREAVPAGNSAAVNVFYDGRQAIGGSVMAVSADDDRHAPSNPALRSGRDTSTRHDPYAKSPAAKSKTPVQKPSISNLNPPQQLSTGSSKPPPTNRDPPPHMDAGPGPSTRPLPPMHPINTEEGWRQHEKREKGKGKAEDAEMPDTPKRPADNRQWRFTSDVQESVSVDAIHKTLLSTNVTLTIQDILGASHALQKKMQESTQRRREYVTNSGEYEIFSPEVAASVSDGRLESRYTDPRFVLHIGRSRDDQERVQSLMTYFSSLHAIPNRMSRYLAFATGQLTVKIHNTDVRCLVDTGSELNLISNALVESLGLAIDIDGTRWSLSGVNGGSDRLMGLCRDTDFNTPPNVSTAEYDYDLAEEYVNEYFY